MKPKTTRYADKSVSAKLTEAQLKAVNEAVDHYNLNSIANVIAVSLMALVEARKAGSDLAIPLRFITSAQKYAIDRLDEMYRERASREQKSERI